MIDGSRLDKNNGNGCGEYILSKERRTQVDYILWRPCNLKEIGEVKVMTEESVARKHWMVVCKITLVLRRTKRAMTEQRIKWWKLKKEDCYEDFRESLKQACLGHGELKNDWVTTAKIIRETGREVFGVSYGLMLRRLGGGGDELPQNRKLER